MAAWPESCMKAVKALYECDGKNTSARGIIDIWVSCTRPDLNRNWKIITIIIGKISCFCFRILGGTRHGCKMRCFSEAVVWHFSWCFFSLSWEGSEEGIYISFSLSQQVFSLAHKLKTYYKQLLVPLKLHQCTLSHNILLVLQVQTSRVFTRCICQCWWWR